MLEFGGEESQKTLGVGQNPVMQIAGMGGKLCSLRGQRAIG